MQKPCKDCPFRKDVAFSLPESRRRDIAQAVILGDDGFPCHKTVERSYSGDRINTDNERPCIGAALMTENVRGDMAASLYFRLAIMIGYIVPDNCDRSIEVFDSVKEFNEAD